MITRNARTTFDHVGRKEDIYPVALLVLQVIAQ
jgi:hypothetical protein